MNLKTSHEPGARWSFTPGRRFAALLTTAAMLGGVAITAPAATAVPSQTATSVPTPTATPEAPTPAAKPALTTLLKKAPKELTEAETTAQLKAASITCTPTEKAKKAEKKYPCRFKTQRRMSNAFNVDLRVTQKTVWQMSSKGRQRVVSEQGYFQRYNSVLGKWFLAKIATSLEVRMYDCYTVVIKGKKHEECKLKGDPRYVGGLSDYNTFNVSLWGPTAKSSHRIVSWLKVTLKRKHRVNGKLIPYLVYVKGVDSDKQIALTEADLKD